jgi:hypothetical protein
MKTLNSGQVEAAEMGKLCGERRKVLCESPERAGIGNLINGLLLLRPGESARGTLLQGILRQSLKRRRSRLHPQQRASGLQARASPASTWSRRHPA